MIGPLDTSEASAPRTSATGPTGLKVALERGADPNGLGVLSMPVLCDAAGAGDVVAIAMLLDGGADIELAIPGGWTPLIVAANAGRADAVRLLLARGANRDAKTSDGYTAYGRVSELNPDVSAILGDDGSDDSVPMPPGRLQEIEVRAVRASRGPWRRVDGSAPGHSVVTSEPEEARRKSEDDLAFGENVRRDIDLLIAEVYRLRALLRARR